MTGSLGEAGVASWQAGTTSIAAIITALVLTLRRIVTSSPNRDTDRDGEALRREARRAKSQDPVDLVRCGRVETVGGINDCVDPRGDVHCSNQEQAHARRQGEVPARSTPSAAPR